MKQYFIGIDIGTSAAKTLLMDEHGVVTAQVSREYPLYQPANGWAEQDPEDWRNAVFSAVRELVERSQAEPEQVMGIGFSGQMHGLVMLDENGKPIRRSIIWCDQRSAAQTQEMCSLMPEEKWLEITANPPIAAWTAAKILWMRKEEPENWEKCRHILLPKDYIRYCLTGVFATDVSDASGMQLLDVKNRVWSDTVLECLSIDKAMLAQVFESQEVTGTLLPEAAKELGLTEKVKVVAGAADNAAAAVGTGTVGDGACNISLGTSGTVFISSDKFGVDENNALHSFDHADGSYHLMGCMLSAASCNKWWMDDIIGTKDYGAEQENITKLGENHVFFLPYLMGERSPHNDPNARGTFIGLTMDTTRADMTQAVLEGVAFALRDSFEVARSLGIHIARTRICGGGAKSPLWKKIVANVLNIPVDIPENEQGPSMGGAMLAAVACGEYPTVRDAAEAIVKLTDTVEPEPELAAKYEERYQKFRKIYPACRDLFLELAK